MGEGLEQLPAQEPAGRPATADEIAEAIAFLAMDRSSTCATFTNRLEALWTDSMMSRNTAYPCPHDT
jgi:hypothetical protein